MRLSDPYYVEAASKVLDVLNLLDNGSRPMRLVEIAGELGLTKSTAFRLIYTLEQKGYVARDSFSRKYRVTAGSSSRKTAVPNSQYTKGLGLR